ncbi:hypothetical protein L6R52_14270 [Myxococcota bacterium]|nr:hypothetical protein [Myxococcota bacterium]
MRAASSCDQARRPGLSAPIILALVFASACAEGRIGGITSRDAATRSDAGLTLDGGGADDASALDADDARDAGAPDAEPGLDAAARDAEVVDATSPDTGPRVGRFVAVGYAGRRATSLDGITWTDDQQDVPGPGGDDDIQFRGVGFGAGRFVAVGGSSRGRVMWSDDGATWVDASNDRGWLGGVAWTSGRFVAAGGVGRYVRSSDGATWTNPGQLSPPPINYRAIAAGGGRWVAVGDMGRRTTTTDGVTWTGDVTGGASLTGVTWAGDRFVAVGSSGRRVVSLDGATWIDDVTGGGALRAVTFGDGKIVAVGGARIAISTDGGQSWDDHTSAGASFTSVAYGNGTFVATGFSGSRYTSPDAITWTIRAPQDGTTFVSVTYGE